MLTALLFALAATSPAAVPASGPDPAVRIWLNNDRRFLPGDRAKVEVRTADDGFLLVLHVDTDGRLRILFPLDPSDDNYVRGGRKYQVVGRGGREAFVADGDGRGVIYAAVSRDPFEFGQYVVGDHWDYRTLNQSQYPTDPEAELNDLVQKMARGRFYYDLVTYDVAGRVAYDGGGNTTVVVHDYDTPYSWGSACFGCGLWRDRVGFGISVGWTDPYWGYARPVLYDPWYYDPWYYDSWYYSPAYYRPYGWYQPWYGRPWGPRIWDGDRYVTATPYRFKQYDRRWSANEPTYRDRMYRTNLVNTVVGPVPGRDRIERSDFTGRRWDGSANPVGQPARGGVDAGAGRPLPGDAAGGRPGRDWNNNDRGRRPEPTGAPVLRPRDDDRGAQPQPQAQPGGITTSRPEQRDPWGIRDRGRRDNTPERATPAPQPQRVEPAPAPTREQPRAEPRREPSNPWGIGEPRRRDSGSDNARPSAPPPSARPEPRPQPRAEPRPAPPPSRPAPEVRGGGGGGGGGGRSAPPPSGGGGGRRRG